MKGSIIVPAHNEAALIGHSLSTLLTGLHPEIDVVVVCNGCTDNTAAIARTFGDRLSVIELADASKSAALRAGESVTRSHFPRLYVDADVVLEGSAASLVLRRLSNGARAARPRIQLDSTGASPILIRYYRARSRIPATSRRLWGAGVYGLSPEGRSRFGPFPDVMGDDYFVDQHFADSEIEVVNCRPVIVRTPRGFSDHVRQARRTITGNRTVRGMTGSGTTWQASARAVAATSMNDREAFVDGLAFVGVTIAARVMAHRVSAGWERDQSTRQLDIAP